MTIWFANKTIACWKEKPFIRTERAGKHESIVFLARLFIHNRLYPSPQQQLWKSKPLHNKTKAEDKSAHCPEA